jgi:hypothetical protein
MSLHQLAQELKSRGRGNDTQLLHVTPKELNTLQGIAKAHGGTLTTNPDTGLPEAGFLDAILPAVAGAGLSLVPGVGPLMAAGIVGGGTALLSKDLNKGLMAGLGAFGGASLAGGLMEAGAAGAGEALVAKAGSGLSPAELAANADAGLYGAGANAGQTTAQAATAFDAANPAASLTPIEKLQAGIKNTTFNTDYFKKNMLPLSAMAAPLLMGGGSGGNLFGGNQQAQTSAPGYIRPYTYQQTRNPGYTGAGTPFFTQTMTPGTPVAAADFGATTMADGGITSLPSANPAPGVVVYDPVSGRYIQQAADTVPMTPAAAPAGGMMSMQYDPMARQYVTPAPAAAPMAATAAPAPIDYSYGNDGDGNAGATDGGTDDGGNDGGGSDGGSDGSGEGWNTGGLMRYAMGGDIGMRYQSPDDMGMGDRIGAHAAVNMGPQFPMQGQYQGYAQGGGIYNLGSYSDGGRLLKGPGDGVSDDIPAQIGARQPARLADGEFVVPARIVSELGNGSTDAGAKRLYAMMDRVQQGRKKSVGKDKVAVDSKAYKHLPA